MRPATIAAVTLAAALALTGCASDAPAMPGMDHGADSFSSAEAVDANSADVMFAQMMIPHHEQAVEMSDMLLAKTGIDPEVTALAEQIKAAQQPEIEQMEEWLDAWGADMPGMDDMDGMHHGDGMMSEDDMEALEAATGTEAARLFLEQMIEHHEGAIDMAQDEVDDGQNADAVALANDIIASQTEEIATMRELLAQL
ncbi:DUF305 domain-containing protein [Microbacterium aurantiacum]|uniref:DUF305 domain-containing protein n=2 Tax=Microbacterium aurantiacum TaxID=162393 RepID=A0A0M9VL97_9MICO|nr:DUF305 domain-containing protein [Microbacterium chocolatum]KOS10919.1 hypothetical protein XI38_08785 [Microbacterium chocolatum]